MDLFSPKFLLVGVVALIVLGPERLPAAARTIGALLADYRRVSADLQSRASEAVDSAGLREPLEDLRQPLQELRRPFQELRRPLEATRTVWSSASMAAGAVVPDGPATVTPDARVVVSSSGWTVWDGSTVDPAAAETQAAQAG